MPENEVFVFLLGTIVLGFILAYRAKLTQLPAFSWLLASYVALWIGWLATVLEHIIYPTLFNLVEHMSYAANGILLFAWCWFGIERGAERRPS